MIALLIVPLLVIGGSYSVTEIAGIVSGPRDGPPLPLSRAAALDEGRVYYVRSIEGRTIQIAEWPSGRVAKPFTAAPGWLEFGRCRGGHICISSRSVSPEMPMEDSSNAYAGTIGTINPIPPPKGTPYVHAVATNRRGDLAVTSFTQPLGTAEPPGFAGARYNPKIWSSGAFQPLAGLSRFLTSSCLATDINDRGDIVGYCIAGEEYSAFVHSGGRMVKLTSEPGEKPVALAVSDNGMVVGLDNVEGSDLWPEGCTLLIWDKGKRIKVRCKKGETIGAVELNNRGDIAYSPTETQAAAAQEAGVITSVYLRTGGSTINVRTLLPRPNAYRPIRVLGINDNRDLLLLAEKKAKRLVIILLKRK